MQKARASGLQCFGEKIRQVFVGCLLNSSGSVFEGTPTIPPPSKIPCFSSFGDWIVFKAVEKLTPVLLYQGLAEASRCFAIPDWRLWAFRLNVAETDVNG